MTFSKIIKKISHKFRKHYYKNKINNHNVTILSNDCSAGFIYHHYGLKFHSPTINLYFDKSDFLVFAENIRDYISGELLDDGIHNGCPSGVLVAGNNLPSIKLFFLHYDSFESAKFFWEKRKKELT